MSVFAEFRSTFVANTKEEADALVLALFEATEEIVCPTSDDRREVCAECAGTAVNPPGNDTDPDLAADPMFAAGAPCWCCSPGTEPGTVMRCARDHAESATVHPDGKWLDSDDRALIRRLDAWLRMAETEGTDALVASLRNARASFCDVEPSA